MEKVVGKTTLTINADRSDLAVLPAALTLTSAR